MTTSARLAFVAAVDKSEPASNASSASAERESSTHTSPPLLLVLGAIFYYLMYRSGKRWRLEGKKEGDLSIESPWCPPLEEYAKVGAGRALLIIALRPRRIYDAPLVLCDNCAQWPVSMRPMR